MHSRSFGEEIEDDTIGDLHPDEDDLFSGVTDALGSSAHAKTADDFEDSDLFSSGGGMELEGDELLVSGKRISGLELDGDPAYNEEDSELKALFEQYGDIRTIYTACKHQGFVLVSYYDLRAAQNAMKALQNSMMKPSQKGQDEPDLGHNLNDILFLRQKGVSSGVIASGGSLENGYNHRFQSASQLPLNAFIDNTIFHSISNTARGASAVTVSDAQASERRHIQGMSSTGNLAEFNAGGKFNILWKDG
ncbi:hypothetical protein P8452_66998 [Trifolium repens]|nr:hypothetical protein P8452_66998 [Trifolium repens]